MRLEFHRSSLISHCMQELHPINIFLMEVKVPAVKLALEDKRNIFPRTKGHDLPLTLKKVTLARKADGAARVGSVWTPI